MKKLRDKESKEEALYWRIQINISTYTEYIVELIYSSSMTCPRPLITIHVNI